MRLDPRWRKILRDLWLHRARTLLVVFAVATGLIGAGAVLDAWALVRRATIEGYHASLPVSATLRVSGVDRALLERLRAMPELAAVRRRQNFGAAVQVGGAWKVAVLYGLEDFQDASIARLQADGGAWPPRDGGLVIERSSLDFAGAELGGPVELQFGKSAPQAFAVTGIVRDLSLAPGWMEHVVYLYATPATLAGLGIGDTFNEVQLRVRDDHADRDSVRRIAYAAKALIERNGGRVDNVDVPVPGEHVHAAQMDSLLMVQGAFGLLGLLVCGFLVVNLISALLARQLREIAVMKTLGAADRQIAAMYVVLALILGMLASAIALPAAVLIGRAYADFRGQMLNFPIDAYAIPWWTIALQIAVGCLLPVIAAALPVRRACRLSVGEALRDIGIVATGQGLQSRRAVLVGGWSRPLLLSIGNAFRRRQRMLLTLLALAAGGAVYLGAANLRGAVIGSVDLMFDSQRYDFLLRLADARPAVDVESALAGVDGVLASEVWRSARVAFAHGDGMQGDGRMLTALPAASTMVRPSLIEGRWLRDEGAFEVVVTRGVLKDEPGLRTGATVDLVVAGQRRAWTLVGVVDGGPQPLLFTSRGTLDALRGNTDAGIVVVDVAGGAGAQLDAIRRVRDALDAAGMPVNSSQLLSENRRVIEDHLLMVVDFLAAMGWVMVLVGGMGLASTMSLGVLERTREIGVLRAIGARHRTITLMIQIEGSVIAVLGWLCALPLSVPVSVLLADAFERVMFTVPTPYLPDGGAVLRWLLASMLISMLACAWPARRATRIPTAAALAYE